MTSQISDSTNIQDVDVNLDRVEADSTTNLQRASKHNTSAPLQERRKGPSDRRNNSLDRRNEDRLLDDFEPRRNPDIPDRRTA